MIGLTLAIMFAECWTIEHDHIDDDDDDCKFQNSTTEFDRFDEKILLRKKRNFGGKEPIDFTKAFNAIFGHPGIVFLFKFVPFMTICSFASSKESNVCS